MERSTFGQRCASARRRIKYKAKVKSDRALSHPCSGRCNSPEDLSREVCCHLSEEVQKTFIERYNIVFDESNDATKAERATWEGIHKQYEEGEPEIRSKLKVAA
ncbi:MAG: ChaB family protein [Cyanobacteriota bacterium]|nr:ChaB family protein [Cyanobacteriota bacterium]